MQILVGTGVVIFVGGIWYLTTLNTSIARNVDKVPVETTDTREVPPESISETQGAAIGEGNEVTFTCAGGKSMIAIFTRDILALTLSDGRQIRLRESVTDSGIRYRNSEASIELSGIEDDAFLKEGTSITYSDCVTN